MLTTLSSCLSTPLSLDADALSRVRKVVGKQFALYIVVCVKKYLYLCH